MGQYHVLANLDKKEIVHPYGIGLGLKQWEQVGDFYGTLPDAMYILCMSSPASGGGDLPRTEISGRWAGDKVVVLGDYTTFGGIRGLLKDECEALFREATAQYTDISARVNDAFKEIFGESIDSNNHWKKALDEINQERTKHESNS